MHAVKTKGISILLKTINSESPSDAKFFIASLPQLKNNFRYSSLEIYFRDRESLFPGLENGFPGLENGFPSLENGFQCLENGFQGRENGFQGRENDFQCRE